MLAKSNLFLVGPMGSGKSAVGKQLSRLLRRPFYDSDLEIERRTGVDIPYIFEKEGEVGFRQRENETLEILTAMEQIVMATGRRRNPAAREPPASWPSGAASCT